MPAFQRIVTDLAATPKATYSQGALVGDLLYTAGFGPHDPDTGEVTGTSIAEQTRQAMANLAAVLRAADLTFADVFKVNVHLQNLGRDMAGFQEVYAQSFSEPYPIRTTVESGLPGILVEIEMVARIPAAS